VIERPILFSGPMVRAILAEQKTQTRRVMREQPAVVPNWSCPGADGLQWPWATYCEGYFDGVPACGPLPPEMAKQCPYGAPGDRLWVREAFRYAGHGAGPEVHYPASLSEYDRAEKGPWKPSIHMPRSASRITLDVTEVRAQRLHDIAEDDAKAEGVEPEMLAGAAAIYDGPPQEPSYRHAFGLLWDSINGKRAPWSSNPWVWAVTFRRAA
jgi:hypothetical protein